MDLLGVMFDILMEHKLAPNAETSVAVHQNDESTGVTF